MQAAPLATAAVWAIEGYRRWISPHKGFACAWRVHRGGASCSRLGQRAIRRHGLFTGLILLRERTRRCGDVYRSLEPCTVCDRPRAVMPGRLAHAGQRGDCDIGCDGCDGCDLGDGRGLARCGCDVADVCSSCGCDWPFQSDQRKKGHPGDTPPTGSDQA